MTRHATTLPPGQCSIVGINVSNEIVSKKILPVTLYRRVDIVTTEIWTSSYSTRDPVGH